MPDIIKLKRSGVAGAAPTSLELGEPALNYADGVIYYKNSSGAIVAFGGADTLLRSLFVPPAPTNVTASAGNAQVTVSWTAPTVLAQTPITDYVVQYSSNSGSSWTTFSDGTSATASATVTGLTNGTAYTFRVAAVNGVGQGAWSTASAAATPQAGDPLFGKVSLLLHMDGSGSTFVDSSKYGSTVTAYGNATQSATQSKWGGKSLYLDGDGRLSIPSDNAFNFGGSNGAFCVEFWMYMTAYASNYTTIITRRGPSNWQWQLGFPNTGRYLNFSTFSGISFTGQDSAEVPLNTWQHVALAYDGTTYRLYRDGALVASSTASGGFEDTGSDITIGAVPGGGENFTGYIDDLRITKGSNRGYTGATITVPTAAFPEAVPGTDLWIDDVSLLLHMDAAPFVDSSSASVAITSNGVALSTAVKKFGAASMQSNSSYLSVSDGSVFDFGASGTFTVEMWYRRSVSQSSNDTLYQTVTNTGSSWGHIVWATPTGQLNVYERERYVVQDAAAFPNVDQWYFLALSVQSGNLSAYVDGALVATGSFQSNAGNGTRSTDRNYVGGNIYNGFSDGWIDEFRVTKGVARYSGSTITVPTAAFPSP